MEATVHRPGEGERIGGPTAVTIKATGEETNNSFYLGEGVAAPGFPGPPPHVHERVHDMFYVLGGVLTMRLGDETTELPAGCFVRVPPGRRPHLQQPGCNPGPVPQLQYARRLGELHARPRCSTREGNS
jgi:mannose-6-phosphate isomerase-like protein (cupin superfamily)